MVYILKVSHYYQLMFLKTLEKRTQKFMKQIQQNFVQLPDQPAALEKVKGELELTTDIGMLLMVEKRITGGLCHSINRYAKAHNKYI